MYRPRRGSRNPSQGMVTVRTINVNLSKCHFDVVSLLLLISFLGSQLYLLTSLDLSVSLSRVGGKRTDVVLDRVPPTGLLQLNTVLATRGSVSNNFFFVSFLYDLVQYNGKTSILSVYRYKISQTGL